MVVTPEELMKNIDRMTEVENGNIDLFSTFLSNVLSSKKDNLKTIREQNDIIAAHKKCNEKKIKAIGDKKQKCEEKKQECEDKKQECKDKKQECKEKKTECTSNIKKITELEDERDTANTERDTANTERDIAKEEFKSYTDQWGPVHEMWNNEAVSKIRSGEKFGETLKNGMEQFNSVTIDPPIDTPLAGDNPPDAVPE